MLLSEAMKLGLFHPRCRHGLGTYYPELEDINHYNNEENDVSDYGRYNRAHIENMVQRYKRLSVGSIDPENVARYQAKLREWEDKLSISEKMVDNARKTGRLKIDIQLFARKSSDFSTVYLPKKEYAHVMSELATWATEEQLNSKVFKKSIGNYMYTVENNGFGNFRIIGKRRIK